MRILYLGDVVGKAGRKALQKHLPDIRKKLKIDFTIVCGENAAHGFGITSGIANDLYKLGVGCITLGNHSFDNKEILDSIDKDMRLVRPMNYPEGTPGRGSGYYVTGANKRVFVAQVMGRVFMDPLDDPFKAIRQSLEHVRLGKDADAIIVDMHGEATSEKMALGHYLDGKVSLVVGTHSHIPTADAQILPNGTAYQTDAGMCGDYDSVIGMQKEEPIRRFTTKMNGGRFQPADGEGTVCGVFVETDDTTGLAKRLSPVRIGGRLIEQLPG